MSQASSWVRLKKGVLGFLTQCHTGVGGDEVDHSTTRNQVRLTTVTELDSPRKVVSRVVEVWWATGEGWVVIAASWKKKSHLTLPKF